MLEYIELRPFDFVSRPMTDNLTKDDFGVIAAASFRGLGADEDSANRA